MMSEPSLKEQLEAYEALFEKTGHLYGYESLARKESDPGTYEAVWHILSNICNAAWSVGCMASTSPVAAEGGDALWALHTPTGDAICVSRGITAHPGLLADMIKNFIRLGYEDHPGFENGDIFENNDPHYGGIHTPDFDMCMPIRYKGKLVAWASSVTHVNDVGMAQAGSIGFLNPNVFADGLTFSMEKVGESDRYYPWYDLRIRSRTRTPDYVLGDARGRLAGCITIRERLFEVIEKYGLDFILDASKEYVEDSRRYAVSRVRTQAIPGRIRKSQFKDLAMKGKRVLDPSQDIDCLFNLPMEMTVNADATVKVEDFNKGDVDAILVTAGHGDDMGQVAEIAARTGATVRASSNPTITRPDTYAPHSPSRSHTSRPRLTANTFDESSSSPVMPTAT